VQVTFNGPVVVPANPPTATVTGYAVTAGTSGNIKALDINGTCCVANNQIFVKNPAAFSGGQDPQSSPIVQQSDIDGAINSLATQQQQTVQITLQKKIASNERQAGSTHCTNTHSADHAAGDRASTVTVTLTATCTTVAYDLQTVQMLVSNLLKDEVAKNLNLANYMLTGGVVATVTQATVIDTKGTVSLFVKAEGMWVYQFTDASKAALARLIAGKSTSEAETLLANAAGVEKVDSIDISGGGSTLPADPKQITIVVLGVPGLQGTPTPPPGPDNTSTVPGGPTATPTPQNGIGGSYGWKNA
jgi:hypothetical protein